MAGGKPKKGWKILQKAIKAHKDMNQRDAAGFTAMLHAARLNLPGVISELAGAGANVNLRSYDGNTPFHYACFREHWNAMTMLIRLGADPDAVDTNGRTALIRAIECQDEELVTKLLELGASPQACGLNDTTPLFAALSHSLSVPRNINTCIVKRLLDAGSDVNTPNRGGTTPLTFVCLQHRCSNEIIDLLIQRGATVNARDTYGRTPLTHCLRTDISTGADCMSILLRAGADTNLVDSDGHTSLSIWAQDLNTTLTYGYGTGRDHQKTLKQLLACGANPNIVTNQTNANSLLHKVVHHGKQEETRALLAAGAENTLLAESPEESQALRQSPLVSALLHNKFALAKLLIDGLFYTKREIDFLSKFCSSENTNKVEKTSSFEKLANVSFSERLIRSKSRSDMRDLYESYCSLNMSTLSLDANSNLTNSFFRRSPSFDNVLSIANSYKMGQSRENLVALPNDSHVDNREKGNVPVLKRAQSRKLDLDIAASTLQVEPEQILNLDQPKTRELVDGLRKNVPSLKQMCRRQVHRSIRYGGDRDEAIRHLPVGPRLQRYLSFQITDHHLLLKIHSSEALYV
jgi:ankyrin repeat protein